MNDLGWRSKKGDYYASNSGYIICWTGGKSVIYTASYQKEAIIYTKDKQSAKNACFQHNKNKLKISI